MGRKRSRARYAGSVQKMVPSLQQGNRSSVPDRRYGILDALQLASGRTPPSFGDIQLFPRDPHDDNAFGPGFPLPSEPLDQTAAGSGQPAPRIWQYPVAWNLPGNGNREVPWQVLRASAGSVDIIRQCIEQRKRKIRQLKWRWSVSTQAIQDAYASDPRRGREDAENTLREKFLPEINRLTDFWDRPWRSNGWKFGQWINAVMEEMLVLDALPIYPRRSLAGNVLDLEVVDGSTIKPLLDVQGRRPSAPFAAFQQILYGFPRGEYRASGAELDEQGNIVQLPGGLSAAELIYHVENVRTHSPYGLSPVENALISARLYLKRQGWMLAEYEDGSTPLTWIIPPENPALAEQFTPTVRRQWEDSMNAELSGDTRRRARGKVLPPGWTAVQTQSADERFKPDYDIHLIKLVCAHLQTPISELGYSEAKGLGTTGYHEGMSEVSGAVGQRPDQVVLAELIQDISRDVLDAPRELEFSFIDPAAEDAVQANTVQDSQFKRGVITLNDNRRALGLALYDFPEADMPMLVGVGPQGTVFLEGLAAQQAAQTQMQLLTQQSAIQGAADEATATAEQPAEGDDTSSDSGDTADAEKAIMPDQAALVREEIRAYRRWIMRRQNAGGVVSRPFAFKHATPDDLHHDMADYRLEELATFEGWIWVPDEDVELFIEADLVKGDGWRKLARDSRGRWMKLGSLRDVELGPEKPHENVLERLRREAHGRVNGRSSTIGHMDKNTAFRLEGDAQRAASEIDSPTASLDEIGAARRAAAAKVFDGMSTSELMTASDHLGRGRITSDMSPEDARANLAQAILGRHPRRNREIEVPEPRKPAPTIGGTARAAVPPDAQRGTPESPAGRAFGSLSENAGWADGVGDSTASSHSAAEHLAAIRGMRSREEVRTHLAGIKSKPELRAILDERDKDTQYPLKRSATAQQIRDELLRQEGVRIDSDALMGNGRAPEQRTPLSAAGMAEVFRGAGGTPYQGVAATEVMRQLGGTKRQKAQTLERMVRDREITLSAADEFNPERLLERVSNGDASVMMRINASGEAVLGKA